MKLYVSRRAPNPRRVSWYLAEKGVSDIEIVDVDLLKGEHKVAAFLHKFGVANVPALEMDDGTTIAESLAICRYLESLYPEPNMFGRDPKEAAIIEMWTRRAEMMAATPLMQAVRHIHPALAVLETQSAEIGQFYLGRGERGLTLLDRRLAENEFIAGERLTMADIVLACGIDFARLVRFRPPPELIHVGRWLAAMMARPAAGAGV